VVALDRVAERLLAAAPEATDREAPRAPSPEPHERGS
jgi:hypothetical protein